MTSELERFEHYLLAHNAKGQPLQIARSKDEMVFLGFDLDAQRLVEIHVLRGGVENDAALKRSAHERAVLASEIRGPSFVRVLEVGENDGLLYYASTLNDGEFVEDYIARRGALPAATTFCLLLQLLEDLVQLQSYHRLISHVRLNRLLVTTLEDTFLQLRVFDFGLAEKEQRTGGDLQRLAGEVCELIFLLLTGEPYSGGNPDRFPALTCLPSSLRATLRSVLADRSQAPMTLDKLRDDVKEAFAAMVSSLQVRNTRKHLVVSSESLLPLSQLQSLLLENVAVDELLSDRFITESGETARRYPFSIPARNPKNDQALTVHLLPPARIVPKDQYEAVPPQMWRFDPQKHPHILRSLSLWESPDWTFLTEEREHGFALSRLIAERITLNPAEVLVLLKQVRDGIDEAIECGVTRVDLHPSNMLLLVGKGGPAQSREFDRLMQKRIDAWPAFRLKLRPHMTMRSLYEPLLVDRPVDQAAHDPHLHDKDFRSRSFVALAAYMLSGERLMSRRFEFPETVPSALAQYLGEVLAAGRHFGKTPQPADFLAAFEKYMGSGAEDGSRLAARILGGARISADDMESAGSVSDFGDDDSTPSTAPVAPISSGGGRKNFATPLHRQPARKRGLLGMAIWTAAVLVAALLLLSFFGGDSEADTTTSAAAPLAASGGTAEIKKDQPQSAAKKMLIMIRKAIVPSREEVEQYKRSQTGVEPKPADGSLADRNSSR